LEKHRFYAGLKGKPANHIIDNNEVHPDWSHERKAAEVEFYLAKKIGEDLVRTYPGRQWMVDVDSRNEIIIIVMPSLTKREGYHLHMRRDNLAALIPRCRKAAGEILERFNVSRSRLTVPDEQILALPRDLRDDAVAPGRYETNMKFNRGR
jgi:hypothetical protein